MGQFYYETLNNVRGLQCWGQASIISMKEEPEEFAALMNELGILQRLKQRGDKLPAFHYRFIKIVPHKIRLLNLREGIYNVTWTK
jgi:hypothetical protein